MAVMSFMIDREMSAGDCRLILLNLRAVLNLCQMGWEKTNLFKLLQIIEI
jgi:hypothetical protein